MDMLTYYGHIQLAKDVVKTFLNVMLTSYDELTGVRCKLSSRDILTSLGCKRYDDNPTSFSYIANTSKRSDNKTSMQDVILTLLFGCMCKLTLHDILTYFGCQNITKHVHLLLSLQIHPARTTLRRLCRTSN